MSSKGSLRLSSQCEMQVIAGLRANYTPQVARLQYTAMRVRRDIELGRSRAAIHG